MIKFTNNIILIVSIFISNSILGQKIDNQKPNEISIQDAIEKKILEIRITGNYDPNVYYEVLDNDGVHYGKCMSIILKSKIDSLILVRLDDGIELIPDNNSVQTMIVTKKAIFPVYPKTTYITRFYAMCGEIHDEIPTTNSSFKLGKLSNKNTINLATYLDRNYIQNMIGQHAMWALRDNINKNDLIKYGGNELTVSRTINILNKLKIKTNLNANYKTIKSKETNPLIINKFFLFIGYGFIFILIIYIAFLVIKTLK